MSRREELAKGIQATAQPMIDQKQLYPAKKPEIPARANAVTVKSSASFKVLPLGLEVGAQVDEVEWAAMGEQLFTAEKSLSWLIGDWLCAGDFKWGAYKKFAQDHERNWLTVTDYAYICRNVHLSCRHDKLSLSHHKIVAPLYDESDRERTRELQRSLLQYAAENGLNKHEFREVVRQITEGTIEQVAESDTPALPENVIEAVTENVVIHTPFWQKPLDKLERDFMKRWQSAPSEDRQAALKRLKSLVKELERME